MKNSNEVLFQVQWTRNGQLFTNFTPTISNYSSNDGIFYDTLTIPNASRNDTGLYECQYGEYLTATAQVIVNQCMSIFISLIIHLNISIFRSRR